MYYSFKFWSLLLIGLGICQTVFSQLAEFDTYRQRADACLKTHTNDKYALPPQSISQISNSYVYLDSYSSITAQLSLYRTSNSDDVAEIVKRLSTLIAIQKDINIKFTFYENMNPDTRTVEGSSWYSGFMMYSYLYIRYHLEHFNINDPKINSQLAAFEVEAKKFMTKIDFTLHAQDAPRIFANLGYPKIFACYLATALWPNEKDVYGKRLGGFRAKYKAFCDYILYSNFHKSVAEIDAVTYGRIVAEFLKLIAEYAPDLDVKNHAQATFQYLLATIGADYNNGMSVVCPERAKGLEMNPNRNPLYRTTWLFYGFYKRTVNGKTTVYSSYLKDIEGQEQQSVWLSLPGTVEASDFLLAVQASKDSTITWYNEREDSKDNEKKYVSPNYTLASAISQRDGAAGRAEGKNNTLAWRNPDKSVDWLTICQENNVNERSKDGENPNARLFHHQKTLIGVYDVPDNLGTSLNYYRPFLPFDTTSGRVLGYLYDFSKPNWVFCHTGYMMYGMAFFGATGAVPKVQSKSPLFFAGYAHYFLLDDRKGAWILETAEASEKPYIGKSRLEQLRFFRDQITSTNQPRVELRLNDPKLPAKITYNSLTSGKLALQLYESRNYKDEMTLNDITITNPYPDSVINSPYMRQAKDGDIVYMGKAGSEEEYTIRWEGNCPPYIYSTVNGNVRDPDFGNSSYEFPLILETGKNEVSGFVDFRSDDPESGKNLTYDFRYINGPSVNSRPLGTTRLALDLVKLTKDTTIIFKVTDPQGGQTIDSVLVYVTRRPSARFDPNQRNQFLPNETIKGVFIGKDMARKVLDVAVVDSLGNRLSYKFTNTKADSIITTVSMSPRRTGNHKLTGVARSWIRTETRNTTTVYVRNIVIQNPTPNLVLYRNSKTVPVSGAMNIPANATEVAVSVLVYKNGLVTQILPATISSTTYSVIASLPVSLSVTDRIELVARMTYTLNGNQTESSYPVVVRLSPSIDLKLGTNSTVINENAILELESTRLGLLLPKVALTKTTALSPMIGSDFLSSVPEGMLVFNTSTRDDVKQGCYFSNGISWGKLVSVGNDILTLGISDPNTDGSLPTNSAIITTNKNITLSPARAALAGKIYYLRNTLTTANIIISELIDFGATQALPFTLTPFRGAITVICDGINWYRIN